MKIQITNNRGQSLVVLMVVVVTSAVILGLGAQFIAIRIKAGEAAKQRIIGSYLVQEALEITRAIARESWSGNISDKTYYEDDNTIKYSPYLNVDNKWDLTPSSDPEEIVLGPDTYKRQIIFHKVSRDNEGVGDIVETGGTNDSFTRRITASVTIGDRVLSIDYYLAEW